MSQSSPYGTWLTFTQVLLQVHFSHAFVLRNWVMVNEGSVEISESLHFMQKLFTINLVMLLLLRQVIN